MLAVHIRRATGRRSGAGPGLRRVPWRCVSAAASLTLIKVRSMNNGVDQRVVNGRFSQSGSASRRSTPSANDASGRVGHDTHSLCLITCCERLSSTRPPLEKARTSMVAAAGAFAKADGARILCRQPPPRHGRAYWLPACRVCRTVISLKTYSVAKDSAKPRAICWASKGYRASSPFTQARRVQSGCRCQHSPVIQSRIQLIASVAERPSDAVAGIAVTHQWW